MRKSFPLPFQGLWTILLLDFTQFRTRGLGGEASNSLAKPSHEGPYGFADIRLQTSGFREIEGLT
jgi:hypothetical protein